jgi:hypothetical protein
LYPSGQRRRVVMPSDSGDLIMRYGCAGPGRVSITTRAWALALREREMPKAKYTLIETSELDRLAELYSRRIAKLDAIEKSLEHLTVALGVTAPVEPKARHLSIARGGQDG